MRNLLTFSAAAAALCLFAVSAPASADTRKVDGLQNGQAVTTELSAHRRRYYARRYYRHRYYYGPRYYYSRPYYYPYAYYGPRYYRPYPYYYSRPGIYFGFGF